MQRTPYTREKISGGKQLSCQTNTKPGDGGTRTNKIMSWSVQLLGSPDRVVEDLLAQSAKMDGQSKKEFDNATSSIIELIGQSFGNYHESEAVIIRLTASGHGQFAADGTQTISRCNVNLECLTARI
jgi:hypothetical protein